jgi:uncharacterized protein with GYD domain
MIFITLAKFRKKPTKEMEAASGKLMAQLEEHGCKFLGIYWTLGRYDVVTILDVPDKGAVEGAVRSALHQMDSYATETLVALKREDALKLLG